jgi:hypothetical protein
VGLVDRLWGCHYGWTRLGRQRRRYCVELNGMPALFQRGGAATTAAGGSSESSPESANGLSVRTLTPHCQCACPCKHLPACLPAWLSRWSACLLTLSVHPAVHLAVQLPFFRPVTYMCSGCMPCVCFDHFVYVAGFLSSERGLAPAYLGLAAMYAGKRPPAFVPGPEFCVLWA